MSTTALVVIYREADAWRQPGHMLASGDRFKQYLCRSTNGLWLSDYRHVRWNDGPLSRLGPRVCPLMVVPQDERLTAFFLRHEDVLAEQGWELGVEPAPPGSIAFTG